MGSKVKQKKQKKQDKRERERERTAALPHTCLSCRVTLPIPGTMALPRSPLGAEMFHTHGQQAETRPGTVADYVRHAGHTVSGQYGVHHEKRGRHGQHDLRRAADDVR